MKLYTEDAEPTHPALQALSDATPAPVGYTQVTDIVLLHRHGTKAVVQARHTGFKDYKALRELVKNAINAKAGFNPADPATYIQANWLKLATAEQSLACEYFVVPKAFKNQVHSHAQQVLHGAKFDACSREAGRTRQHHPTVGHLEGRRVVEHDQRR